MKLNARFRNGGHCSLEVHLNAGQAEVICGEQTFSLSVQKLSDSRCLIRMDGKILDAVVHRNGAEHTVLLGGEAFSFELFDKRAHHPSEDESGDGALFVKAQMPGRVVKILMGADQAVKKGESVLVLEAMKMQNEVRSPRSGHIAQIMTREGATVAAGEVLFEVK
jgi:biotin carboxyl carrier protein